MSKENLSTGKFYEGSDLSPEETKEIVVGGLRDADFGEFYQEKTVSEQLVKENGEYVAISSGSSSEGFGFRAGQGERIGYSFSDVFNKAALKAAIKEARQILKKGGVKSGQPDDAQGPAMEKSDDQPQFGKVEKELYPQDASLGGMTLKEKISKIDALEAYAKSLDTGITNVSISYGANVKDVHIITADGQALTETRPMSTMHIEVQVTDKDGNVETGMALVGGRIDCKDAFNEKACKAATQKALNIAKTLLIAEEAPAGVMDVVLSPGWSAVLLHEAIGHGLEGDFNRKGTSVYSGKIGQKIAGDEVTVIDQGDMQGERGSLHFDDEGTRTQQNVLIEKGVLKKYMQDRQNAKLMGVEPTGNGRRESYAHLPMPRMTNTYFKPGERTPAEIIASVKDGLYISDMGGGQVDITSGKFNMNATLAWRIRDGKICEPIKGAALVGDGATVIRNITMVGNDLAIEKAAGVCGKNGQSVPVGVGQPTIRVAKMTVGGSK